LELVGEARGGEGVSGGGAHIGHLLNIVEIVG
jgi:hypothetical protein